MMDLRKPKDKEGKVTLTPAQRRELKLKLCERQKWRCAKCGTIMHALPGYWNSAELEHARPEPMGCKKRDNDDNANEVWCHGCNTAKGSKRR